VKINNKMDVSDFPAQRTFVRQILRITLHGLLFGVLSSQGATDAGLFPLVKDVSLPEAASKKVAAFHLDEEIFSSTDNRYSNLRLFDDRDNEKPFLVRPAKAIKTETSEHRVEMEAVGFQKLPDNRIELIYSKKHKDNGHLPVTVVFVSALKNYEKQVTVWGSNDRHTWEPLAENKPIFDYSRFVDVRNNRVPVKSGEYNYYKILVANITENQHSPFVSIARETKDGKLVGEIEKGSFRREDFRMDRVDFFEMKESVVRSKSLTRQYPIKNLSVTNNLKEKTTIVMFDTGYVPLTALKLVTVSVNFSRSVRAECFEKNAGSEGWRHIVSAAINRIDAGGFKQDNVRIQFDDPVRSSAMRLIIDNRDSPSLEISGIDAEGEIHEVVFFPDKCRTFRVMYGAGRLDVPVYDVNEVLARVEGADADICSVGPQKNNTAFKKGASSMVGGRRLLVIAVLIMVAGLIWIISRTIKTVNV